MIQDLLLAARPKTLVAAIIPPLVAHFLYMTLYQNTSWKGMFLCLLVALCLQVATNFYNDAIDFLKGTDDHRLGPQTVCTSGKLTHQSILRWGHLFNLLALLIGLPLILMGGWPFIILGLFSLYLTYGYTGGPYPLAYHGLGELFVFLFFGLVAVMGSYYIFAQTLSLESFLLGCQLGLLSSVLITINNFRDRFTDKRTHKKTLATRMSEKNYLNMVSFFLFFPYVISTHYMYWQGLSFLLLLLPLPLAFKIRKDLYFYEHIKNSQELTGLNHTLKLSGIHLLLFGLTFIIGSLWA